jgi:hypothetical protein
MMVPLLLGRIISDCQVVTDFRQDAALTPMLRLTFGTGGRTFGRAVAHRRRVAGTTEMSSP